MKPVLPYADGFLIESPPLVIPWQSAEAAVQGTMVIRGFQRSTEHRSRWTGVCVALDGLRFQAELDFGIGVAPRLRDICLNALGFPSAAEAYATVELHLARILGPPTSATNGTDTSFGVPETEWRFPHVLVRHLVFDRWGPVQSLFFRPTYP